MTERAVWMPRVSRRQILRGGASVLAATALTGHTASAAVGPGSDPVAAGGPGLGRPFTGLRTFVVDVADLGAVGDGRADDSWAFELAYRLAADRVLRGVGRTVIQIPAGEFLITRPYALMNGVAPTKPANGLRFSGAGKRMTTLVFRPEVGPGSYLCRNENIWANLSFERMQFRSATPGASFFSSYSTGQAQDYRFSECEWMGEWEYGLALDGTDTNSEMLWEACRVGGRYRKAFLYSGLTGREQADPNDQDQFLNYWFNDMKVEYEWGNFLEFPYGGSISCRGGSYIITGTRPRAPRSTAPPVRSSASRSPSTTTRCSGSTPRTSGSRCATRTRGSSTPCGGAERSTSATATTPDSPSRTTPPKCGRTATRWGREDR